MAKWACSSGNQGKKAWMEKFCKKTCDKCKDDGNDDEDKSDEEEDCKDLKPWCPKPWVKQNGCNASKPGRKAWFEKYCKKRVANAQKLLKMMMMIMNNKPTTHDLTECKDPRPWTNTND